jgi:hypothetical protein
MTTLEQRIMIPAGPDTIWEYISDLTQNPKWQADCSSISLLTSMSQGQGTRWRYSSPGGRDYVIEILTWYDGLGYEYTYVDGAPFEDSRGRIRLQETADGTVVQWSLYYEMGGVLGGLRSSLGTKRQIENNIKNSLRSLWQEISQLSERWHPDEALSRMRDAPDVEARALYQPKYPTRVEPPGARPQGPVIVEPPISEDDTRPRRVAPVAEPASLESSAERITDTSGASSPPEAVETKVTPITGVTEPGPTTRDTQEHPAATPEPSLTPSSAPLLPPDEDTSEISVFELFGVKKPSDTERMRALAESEREEIDSQEEPRQQLVAPAVAPTRTPLILGERIGLRLALRRTRVKIRRPK